MKLGDLRIGSRLGLGFGVIVVLLIIVASFGVSRLAALDEGTSAIVSDKYPKVVLLNTARNEVNKIAQAVRDVLLATDPGDIKQEYDRIQGAKKAIEATLSRLDKLARTGEGRKLFINVTESSDKYVRAVDQLLTLIAEEKKDLAVTFLLESLRPIQQTNFDAIEKMIAHQTGSMNQAGLDADAYYRNGLMLSIGLALFASAVAVLIAVLATRSITGPILRAVNIARTVSAGDLTSRINVSTQDESGQLLQALKEMNESLVRIVGEVRTGADTIATASGQIASGNQDLSSRTEQQASSLEETASSMEELTSTVKQNADNARQANVMAAAASEVAVKGGAVVAQVVDTMSSINASSKKIVDIID